MRKLEQKYEASVTPLNRGLLKRVRRRKKSDSLLEDLVLRSIPRDPLVIFAKNKPIFQVRLGKR